MIGIFAGKFIFYAALFLVFVWNLGKLSYKIDITFAPHRFSLNTSGNNYQLPLNKKVNFSNEMPEAENSEFVSVSRRCYEDYRFVEREVST
jgi:hypothetical protein